ncbi:hypothetical protein [Streptomyces catenulae]|uniref:Nucleopolyhedrovirus P10 family protein n=1 Tax=Streptomyces catenulae TaxID=66875 RepID=A0ABV2Z7H4_9ACTN|nr:hypothetical protein [Streptomyces catenulae]
MAATEWAHRVRRELGTGRVLPLGAPADGCWITEEAAVRVLRARATALPGLSLGALRIGLVDHHGPRPPAPAPPSALPPGPLRITADLTATPDRPLSRTAEELRTALLETADRALGLPVTSVDLQVTGVLDPAGAPHRERPTPPGPGVGLSPQETGVPDPVADAALAVPGVVRLAATLGGTSRPVRETPGGLLVQVVTGPGHRAVEVARAVRAAAGAAGTPPVAVAVLVTAVDEG